MRRRGTARFLVGLIASYVIYEMSFVTVIDVGHTAFGGWGMVVAVVLLGFGLALLFTAIYDGPMDLGRLLTRRHTVRLHGAAVRRRDPGSREA